MMTPASARTKGIGRTRIKLARMLSEATGHVFLPEKLYPTKGWERSSRAWHNDSFRWTAIPERGTGGRALDSYATMTDCVRYGIEIQDDEVFARGR